MADNSPAAPRLSAKGAELLARLCLNRPSAPRLRPVIVALTIVAALCLTVGLSSERARAGELLYNGIVLPDQWPPQYETPIGPNPIEPPYLANPPAVVPIDVGRQLFVDDFLIESTTLSRTFHQAQYDSRNPVLWSSEPYEVDNKLKYAAPFSDGVWHDPQDGKFKMWYFTDRSVNTNESLTAYAESLDGIHWHKPSLDVVPGTNIVSVHPNRRESATVWLDHQAANSAERFKMFSIEHPAPNSPDWVYTYRVSADGIHWSEDLVAGQTNPVGDRSTEFYNPFRDVWVDSVRWNSSAWGRARQYREHQDPADLSFAFSDLVPWVAADELDPQNPGPGTPLPPQLYNLDAIAYESLMLGEFSIWQAPGAPKRNEVLLGYSRDGFHWSRPDRTPFLPAGSPDSTGTYDIFDIGVISDHWEQGGPEGDYDGSGHVDIFDVGFVSDDWRVYGPDPWNVGNVQSISGTPLIVGDKLLFYMSGRIHGEGGIVEEMATGVATLRRDGFASMNAGGIEGQLTTRPVEFQGSRLFVNVASQAGALRAEILDANDQVIGPFSRENSIPLSVDKTLAEMQWNGAADLSSLAGQAVKIRFYLADGSLYSFWTSDEESGASGGYVGGGGPGYTSNVDTVGLVTRETHVTLPTADTVLASGLPLAGAGTSELGAVGRTAAGDLQRMLMRFDLDEVASDHSMAVSDATLTLRVAGQSAGSQSFALYMLDPANGNWNEGSATWNEMSAGVPWATGAAANGASLVSTEDWTGGDLNFLIPQNLLNEWVTELDGDVSLIVVSLTAEGGVGELLSTWSFHEDAFHEPWLWFDVDSALAGDANLDQSVDIFDVGFVSDRWSLTGPQGDLNCDGIVNVFDVAAISDGMIQAAASVPEPAALSLSAAGLMAIGSLQLARCVRRKRNTSLPGPTREF